jgi:hypothetical protein
MVISEAEDEASIIIILRVSGFWSFCKPIISRTPRCCCKDFCPRRKYKIELPHFINRKSNRKNAPFETEMKAIFLFRKSG